MHDGVITVKHFERHPTEVEGCFGCKVVGVTFGSVPGGTRPGSFRASYEKQFKKDMEAYYSAKKAGEQPDAVSVAGVRKARKRHESLERAKKKVEIVDVREQ